MSASPTMFTRSFFHGTRASLDAGDEISVGYGSNFFAGEPLSWVYFTATLDAAIWAAELATGSAPERIYVVEPTGTVSDDPNLTDKKFPGNPSLSYRSREPLRIIAEVVGWHEHDPEQLQQMKAGIAAMVADGTAHIID